MASFAAACPHQGLNQDTEPLVSHRAYWVAGLGGPLFPFSNYYILQLLSCRSKDSLAAAGGEGLVHGSPGGLQAYECKGLPLSFSHACVPKVPVARIQPLMSSSMFSASKNFQKDFVKIM